MRIVRYIIMIFFAGTYICAAQTAKQQELEEERQRLRQEIEQMRTLRANTKKKEISLLDEIEAINAQINTRENLIKITNQQANILTREINNNLKKMDAYRKELKTLKEDYAKMIVRSYRSKSSQSRIMFLLSSKDFAQAYKRLQYMKQYNEHRKDQAGEIETRAQDLQTLNQDLAKQKKEKQLLVEENRQEQDKLRSEKIEQQTLMATVRKKQTQYTQQIQQKQAQADAIEKAIEKLIREAIAKANKKAGKPSANSGSAVTFSMTPEEENLAKGFTSNRGKLPWPVGTGRLTRKYGRQPHPTLPNIQINSSGVEIETMPGEKARAIFEGEVIAIQKLKGASRLVQVRHGNYITTYYNIENITVTEGQKVSTKQSIGQVRTNPSTGRAVMKFLIFQNAKKLNPQEWIFKM